MSNLDMSYIGQRFYHKREKRFVKAGNINLTTKRITEFNSSNMYNYTSVGSVEFVRPVFAFDSKKQMIFERDIVNGNGIKGGEIVWNPEANCFGIQVDGRLVELFIDQAKQYTVVGTAYELADEL